jgi:hypothetical protein
MHYFHNLFWHENVHVSDSSSVHHQEFIHCKFSNGISYIGLQTAFEEGQNKFVKLVNLIVFIKNKTNIVVSIQTIKELI